VPLSSLPLEEARSGGCCVPPPMDDGAPVGGGSAKSGGSRRCLGRVLRAAMAATTEGGALCGWVLDGVKGTLS
jgi:hypothetical protein